MTDQPSEPSERNYRRLYQAILLRAFDDAMGANLVTQEGPDTKARYRREAREWLSTPSKDLEETCFYAGMSMDQVLRKGQTL